MEYIELSEADDEKYELQVLKAMIDVYNKLKDEDLLKIKPDRERRIIFDTIRAGHHEVDKICKDLKDGKNVMVNFHPPIDTFLLSCVAGGIIWGDDKIPSDGLHPYCIHGERIDALIHAMRLLEACSLIDEVKDGGFLMFDNQYRDALVMIDMWEKEH
jgi:hypothetical protein